MNYLSVNQFIKFYFFKKINYANMLRIGVCIFVMSLVDKSSKDDDSCWDLVNKLNLDALGK